MKENIITIDLDHQPATLLNTSLSLDVLDILLRDRYSIVDDECEITKVVMKNPSNIVQLSSSDNDDGTNSLPLPLWDRIRQKRVN